MTAPPTDAPDAGAADHAAATPSVEATPAAEPMSTAAPTSTGREGTSGAARHRLGLRGWLLLGAILLGFALAVAVVNRFYQAEGGSTVTGRPQAVADGIVAEMEPLALDPRTRMLTLRFVLSANGSRLVTPESLHLTKTVRVTVLSYDGTTDFTFLPGSSLGRESVQIETAGEEANYPFDSYATNVGVEAAVVAPLPGGGYREVEDLPVSLSASGGVYGWDTFVTLPEAVGMPAFVAMKRAFSVKLFALAELAFMLALAVMSLWIAALVVTRRREFESALLGWSASLLFALPVLRTNLPNAPPIGASIDIFWYFWLLLAAMLAAALLAVVWVRRKDGVGAADEPAGRP